MYLGQYIDPMTVGWLEDRMVTCGTPNCRCARGYLHGPYTYLTYRAWDDRAGRRRVRRRYIPAEDVPEVRRLLEITKTLDIAVAWVLGNQRQVLEDLTWAHWQEAGGTIHPLREAIARSMRLIQHVTGAGEAMGQSPMTNPQTTDNPQ